MIAVAPRLPRGRLVRIAGRIAFGLAAGLLIGSVLMRAMNWTMEDMDAYWNAALRLRQGGPLYPPLGDTTEPTVYRYAPWFAYAWIPLTFLAKPLVSFAWALTLVAAMAAVMWRLAHSWTIGGLTSAALFGALMVPIVSVGNVHSLLIAALAFGVERRSAPVWIGLTASLKAVPLLFVCVFLARREWMQAAWTLVVVGLLVGPTLFFDLRGYPFSAGELSYSLFDRNLPAWAILVGALTAFAMFLAARGSRHQWFAASAAALAALPRTFAYDFTFIFVGVPAHHGRPRRAVDGQ